MNSNDEQRRSLGVESRYSDYLNSGDWRIQRCHACNKHVFYPRQLCPHCGSDAFDWIKPSGRGTLYSFSIIHGGPKAGDSYNVALIDLAEGVRMMSRVEGMENQQLQIGMQVRASVIHDASTGSNLVVFNVADN